MTDKLRLKQLPGKNFDDVMGVPIRPTKGMVAYAVPERALEVLDVIIDGEPVMHRNYMGHLGRHSFNPFGLGPLKSIEGAFTAGPENTGSPQDVRPLHGTFSQTPAEHVYLTPEGGVGGLVSWQDIVTGPNLQIHRVINPVQGSNPITPYAFTIEDKIRGVLTGVYKWLYHPNFPVEDGTRFVSSQTLVVPRIDGRSHIDGEQYGVIGKVFEGQTMWPPSEETKGGVEAVRRENFEKCYIMQVQPDADGNVYVALLAKDGKSGAYVRYNINQMHEQQQAFQLWRNPRDGVAGLEFGSDFMGWAWSQQHNLLVPIQEGKTHRYKYEIGFLRNEEQVARLIAKLPAVTDPKYLVLKPDQDKELAQVYRGQRIDIAR